MERINTEDLIEAVRKRKAIWDVTADEYRDKSARTQQWEDLCTSLIPNYKRFAPKDKFNTVLELQKKWKYLRDALIRSTRLRRIMNKKGKNMRPYVYERQLSFLHLNSKQSNDLEAVSVSSEIDANEGADSKYDFGGDQSNGSDIVYEVVEFNQEEAPAWTSKQPAAEEHSFDSDDIQFFRSLLPLMGTLSLRQKIKFRMEVMKMALDFSESYDSTPTLEETGMFRQESSASSASGSVQKRFSR
ncbi:uncharacterized protein LOC131681268 [Topomyia yanbarensis]|uniref:uncharacterized protein LOC131681268 n=1 Tax=Topomyia yanbarensis TaxID=2498891 RepID=UPI00273A936B|nr:uncharacterized protein LOC131681268 [Topomyia yanbarensis]